MKLPMDNVYVFYGFSLLIIFIVIGITVIYIMKYRKKGVISNKALFNISLVIVPVLCLPLWIDPVSTFAEKAISSILAVSGSYAYFIAGDRIADFLRHLLKMIFKK